jgi:pyruvate formate lyase activating enzyme
MQIAKKDTGIVFDLRKYSIQDGPGIRTTVFFKGCPLKCWWCHNPESRKLQPEIRIRTTRKKCLSLSYSEKRDVFGREVTADEIMQEIEKDIIFYDQSGGGVTFSGGEPLMQPEFLYTLLIHCKQKGIHTAIDTSGYAPFEIFEIIYEVSDLFLYDIKLIDEQEHIRYIEISNYKILQNLMLLTQKGNKVIVRIPLIPGITDTEANIKNIIAFLLKLEHIPPVDLLPYNVIGEDKYKRLRKKPKLKNLKRQSEGTLNSICNIFISSGITTNIVK